MLLYFSHLKNQIFSCVKFYDDARIKHFFREENVFHPNIIFLGDKDVSDRIV